MAIAHWQYYLATGNRDWLRDDAWPVLQAAATFWVSRVTPNETGGYGILDVICADEYAEDVDNNAFTNAAARAALLSAAAAAEALGHPAPPSGPRSPSASCSRATAIWCWSTTATTGARSSRPTWNC